MSQRPRLPATAWEVAARDQAAERRLCAALGISPVLAGVLAARAIVEEAAARRFLHPSLGDTHDPHLLPGAERAVQRLATALDADETILVHGDYDADGLTAAALFYRLLRKLGGEVRTYIPSRLRDGFGLRTATVRGAAAEGVGLLLTSDCGSSDVEALAEARRLGLDVIVTDHHQLGPDSVNDEALIVNPRHPDSAYPNKHLSGVGVAYKLGEALVEHLGMPVESYRKAYLDLACVGTITDVCPLVGENRALVKAGLTALSATHKVGLRALMDACRMRGAASVRSVAFGLGPRLNAAGRLGDASEALELLVTSDAQVARRIAGKLERLNRERQELQTRAFEEACQRLEAEVDVAGEKVIVLADPDWHVGVIGIVAAKLVEAFQRPTVLLTKTPPGYQGSARSVPGFDIAAALERCGEHVIRSGGHAAAAGLLTQESDIPGLRARLNEIAEGEMPAEALRPRLAVDREVHPEELSTELAAEFELLAPFGEGNPEPVLCGRGLNLIDTRVVGGDGQHLRLRLAGGRRVFGAIGFGMSHLEQELEAAGVVDVCFTPALNDFGAEPSLELRLHDVRPAQSASGL